MYDKVYKEDEEHYVWCVSEAWLNHTNNTFMRVISVFRDNNNSINDGNS